MKSQSINLLCNLAEATISTSHKLFGHNHKAMEEMNTRLAYTRQKYVVQVEENIVMGNGRTWMDGEADDAVFGKSVDPNAPLEECVEWEQWGGFVMRGQKNTLVLDRCSSGKTAKRAPGPGAIKKVDWEPVAKKYLANRKIILHTDRAKSYKVRIPGVLHDSVRHCKKRVKVKGKWIWKNPYYSKTVTHKIPGGKTLKVKSGSQVIDRAWRFIREHIKGFSKKPGDNRFAAAIRSAQWFYWNSEKDLWAETATMLKELKYR